MVDEVTPAVAAATPNTEVAQTAQPTVTEKSPSSPGVTTTVSNETVVAQAEAPKTETKPAEATVETKTAETLLGADKKEQPQTEVKTEEKPAEAKTEEVKTEEKAVEQPKYEWKLPEGVNIDEAKMGDFNKMLGDFQLSAKIPQEEVQKLGQQMLERHQAEMQRYTESLTAAWNKQANDWKDSFLKSPEFANRTDTVLNAAIDAINTYGGNADQQKEFRELMESSKVGNHPAMIRLLSNIMVAKGEGKPLAAPQIATQVKKSKIETMYGKKSA